MSDDRDRAHARTYGELCDALVIIQAADALAKAAKKSVYAFDAIRFGSLESRFEDITSTPHEIAEKYSGPLEEALAAYEKLRSQTH